MTAGTSKAKKTSLVPDVTEVFVSEWQSFWFFWERRLVKKEWVFQGLDFTGYGFEEIERTYEYRRHAYWV